MNLRFKLPRESYIPKGAIKVADKLSDAVAYLRVNSKGKPSATVFFGKQSKPVANYWYRDEAQREKAVRELFESRQARMAMMSKHKDEAKAFVHSVQVGDIFTTCWGYDQTNREAFEVVEVRGKHAILREIAMASETHGPADRIVPQSGAFLTPRYEGDDRGLPIRRLIQGYSGSAHIKIDDVRSASPWGKREPITGTVIGGSMSRTAAGWGH